MLNRLVTVKGEWWLWVYCAYWTITGNDNRSASTSSSARQRQRALGFLHGQKLVDWGINASTGATRFEFDLGSSLSIRRRQESNSDELWLLYKPNAYVLSLRGMDRATTSRDLEPTNVSGFYDARWVIVADDTGRFVRGVRWLWATGGNSPRCGEFLSPD
jgi:hypothetical protein